MRNNAQSALPGSPLKALLHPTHVVAHRQAVESRDVVQLRQLFAAYRSAFRPWDGVASSPYGILSVHVDDEERLFAGFLSFLRSDARHFLVPGFPLCLMF